MESVKKPFNLLTSVPFIHNTDELSLWIKPIYIVDNYLTDKDTYTEFLTKLLNIVRGCFCIRECREYPIKFKFYPRDKKIHTLQLRHFLVNFIMWYPFLYLEGSNVLSEDYIFDCSTSVPVINDYINEKLIITLRDFNVKSTDINYAISSVLYNLRNISLDFSIIMGLNFSLPTFMDGYENNPEIRDIMEVKLDDSMQPFEVEKKLHELEEREIEIFRNDPNHPVGVLLRANTGVKHKQLAEFTIADGLMPTLDGMTIPEPIENSLLIKGFNKPSYLYIAAVGLITRPHTKRFVLENRVKC